jgi:hypothetical protein
MAAARLRIVLALQINKSDAPFLLGTVEPGAAWLTSYFVVTHFSEANYAAMTSGQFTRCEQFDGSIASCHQNVENLFRQLDGAGDVGRFNFIVPNECEDGHDNCKPQGNGGPSSTRSLRRRYR